MTQVVRHVYGVLEDAKIKLNKAIIDKEPQGEINDLKDTVTALEFHLETVISRLESLINLCRGGKNLSRKPSPTPSKTSRLDCKNIPELTTQLQGAQSNVSTAKAYLESITSSQSSSQQSIAYAQSQYEKARDEYSRLIALLENLIKLCRSRIRGVRNIR